MLRIYDKNATLILEMVLSVLLTSKIIKWNQKTEQIRWFKHTCAFVLDYIWLRLEIRRKYCDICLRLAIGCVALTMSYTLAVPLKFDNSTGVCLVCERAGERERALRQFPRYVHEQNDRVPVKSRNKKNNRPTARVKWVKNQNPSETHECGSLERSSSSRLDVVAADNNTASVYARLTKNALILKSSSQSRTFHYHIAGIYLWCSCSTSVQLLKSDSVHMAMENMHEEQSRACICCDNPYFNASWVEAMHALTE